MDLENKKVLIFQQRVWGVNIGHFLAKKLQNAGCKLATLTLKRTTHDFILKQKDVNYDLILSIDDLKDKPEKYLGNDDYSLEEICDDLNIDSVWPLVMSIRLFVKSYKDKYYYSFRQNLSDEKIVLYIKALYKCTKSVFDNFGPDIIITPNFVTLHHIFFNIFAKKKGIKMIALTDSKVRGYSLFSLCYQDSEGDFFSRIDTLNKGLVESKNRERARQYIKEFRDNFKNPEYVRDIQPKRDIIKIIRHELYPYKEILRWYIKGPSKNYVENIGVTPDYRPPRIILRDHYCEKRYRKFMENFNHYPFEKIKKYIYFPLQFQPEGQIDTLAPYFANQIETARQVAMSLPGDYTLVVKEHPGMVGLRPPSYIEKVARTVNVKLIDYKIPNSKVIKRADMIIGPNGTTFAEAALLRKPVIQLGNLGTTLKLPNVYKHTDMTTLAAKIKEVLKIDLNNEEYEKKLENFVAAVYDTGSDFNFRAVWKKGKGDNMENLWQLYRKEIERLLV